jgi:hypothetical protein
MELKKSTLDTEEKVMRKQATLTREGKHQIVQYEKCNTTKDVNKLWKVWSGPVLDQRQLHTLNPQRFLHPSITVWISAKVFQFLTLT